MSAARGPRAPHGALAPVLPLLVLSYVTGVVVAASLGGAWWTSTAVAAGGVLGWWGLERARVVPPAGVPALVLVSAVALVAAGHARYEHTSAALEGDERAALETLDSLVGREHVLEGVVLEDPVRARGGARFDLALSRIDGAPTTIGAVRMRVLATPALPREGDRLEVRGSLERLRVDDVSYADYLRRHQVRAALEFPSWRVVEVGTGNPLERAMRGLRRTMLENLERALPEPEAALTAGMLLGQRGTLPDPLVAQLRATGTTHLVVVSGQNIALLVGTGIALLTPLSSRRRAGLLVLGALPGYVVLVGADPPVVRAALMAVGLAIAAASGRRTPGWAYLGYASGAMLAADPLLVRDAAFQLSACATAGVLLLAPPLLEASTRALGAHSDGVRRALLEAGATTSAATLATLPVQAWLFETVPLSAVVANVLIAPLYEAILLLGLVAAALGRVGPVADVLFTSGAGIPRLFIATVEALGRWPALEVEMGAPVAFGAAWFALAGVLAWVLGRGQTESLRPGASRGGLATLALGGACAGVWLLALQPGAGAPSVAVLDVGQGLAVLVQDGGARVLIDAGPADGAVLRALPAGSRALASLVVTHADLDHAGGASEVARRLEVGHVLASTDTDLGDLEAEALGAGDRITLSERTSIEVLSPPSSIAASAGLSENDRSLVLLVRLGERRVLVAADIEAAGEAWLLGSGVDLDADALVVPHHGSRTSSTPAFIEAVSPALAVVSAGPRNAFGHPHPEVVERYARAGSTVLVTAERGTITLTSTATGLRAVTERGGER